MRCFLEDDFVRLRAVEPEDARGMWECERDSSQWLQSGMMGPYSRENLAQYAATYNPDPWQEGQIRLVVELRDGEKMAGLIDLYQLSAQNHTAFVGVYVRPELRRRGIATRALQHIEKYARELLNVRVLAAKIVQGNEASRRLFARGGFRYCGTLHHWLQSGQKTLHLNLFEKVL